ncbi:MAG: hypothetical protein JXA78_01345 [Anaerolineales bacterium]|nr:hypothetical protein [Anaerolineales bacterium]
MATIIPILILILAALIMLAIRLRRPGFSYFWLLASFASLLAWLVILLGRLQTPAVIPLVAWQPQEIFPLSPALLLDEISWPFALALGTLNLATVLTAVARAASAPSSRSNWSELASSMLITAASLLGVFAGNLLTLLLAWAAVDLVEMILWLMRPGRSAQGPQVVIAFAWRAAGLAPALWAGMAAYASGQSLSFTAITPQIGFYLLIAAGLRLGILPVNRLLPEDASPQRGAQIMLRLAPQAANLILLARAAATGAPPALAPALLFLASLAALYGGLGWINADDEMKGMPFWSLCVGALALAAAARAQPAASLAWGLALLLPGGLLFLFSTRARWLLPLPLIAVFSLSSLPFSPTWQATRLVAPPIGASTLILMVAQGLMLSGYLRHALRKAAPLVSAERWVWIIYPWGLMLLPLAHFVIAWLSQPLAQPSPSWRASWPAAAVALLATLFAAWGRTSRRASGPALAFLQAALAVDWLYRLLSSAYRGLNRLFSLANTTLEGEAGILWALLLLTLLLSLTLQAGPGV